MKKKKKASRKKTSRRVSTQSAIKSPPTREAVFGIEKNIEIPRWANGSAGRPRKYPFDQLEVGDSFFVPYGDSEPNRVRGRIYSVVSHSRRRRKHGYVTRCEKGGIRVWRNK